MGKRISGIFWGIITGTLLGILFAPKKGKDLRDSIKKERDKGGHGLDAVKKGFIGMGKDLKDTAEEVYESPEVQEQVGRLKRKASGYVDQVKDECEECVGDIKSKAGKEVNKAKRKVKKATTKAKKSLNNAKTKAAKFTKKRIRRKK